MVVRPKYRKKIVVTYSREPLDGFQNNCNRNVPDVTLPKLFQVFCCVQHFLTNYCTAAHMSKIYREV